ncbi:hypothetical protein [Paenibacillus sp. IITD108]|uniref:hypothetical protein n=1 Tax=Paenibacillus sp. IITD108 TaxID=3116649 RepID=UPI002F3F8E83
MIDNSKDIVDAFEELSEAGNGVLAIPPQDEKERIERDKLMKKYLLKRDSKKLASQQK